MKNIVKYVCIISFLLLSTAEIYANNKLPIKPINLKTEYLINPIGIDVITPRLSWEINDERMGALQNAYRILISKDSIALTRNRSLIWDSGKVLSSQTSNIQPDIKCEPMTRYYWKVIFWDKNKKKSLFTYFYLFFTYWLFSRVLKGVDSFRRMRRRRYLLFYRQLFRTFRNSLQSSG